MFKSKIEFSRFSSFKSDHSVHIWCHLVHRSFFLGFTVFNSCTRSRIKISKSKFLHRIFRIEFLQNGRIPSQKVLQWVLCSFSQPLHSQKQVSHQQERHLYWLVHPRVLCFLRCFLWILFSQLTYHKWIFNGFTKNGVAFRHTVRTSGYSMTGQWWPEVMHRVIHVLSP